MSMPTNSSSSPRLGPEARRAFWAMFAVLVCGFALGQFQRAGGGVISVQLTEELGLTGGLLGAVMGTLFLASGAAQIPTGILLDRYGPNLALWLTITLGMVGCAVFAFADAPPGLILGRALIGIGFAGTLGAGYVLFSRWVPPERFSTVMSYVAFAGGFGGLLSTTPLALAFDSFGRQTTFLVLAAVSGLLALASKLFVRNAPPGQPPPANQPESLAESLRGVADILRRREFRWMIPINFMAFAPFMALVGLWAGPFMRDTYGLDAAARGNVLLAMLVTWNLGLLTYGPLDRLLNTRKWVVVGGAALVATWLFTLALLPAPGLWLAVGLLCLNTFSAPIFVVLAAHQRDLYPPHMTGRVLTLANLLSITGVAT
ncbi:MAG: MFS transporter, partial [Alphaproteobacteria bacterium]